MAGTTQYKNKWLKANVDRINLTVPKGQKEQIYRHASAHGESGIGFINRAIHEAMDWDQIFEQSREEIIAIAQKYNVDISEIKKLAQAFAVLEPGIPGIKRLYFSRLQPQEESSSVEVIIKDRSVQ